MKEIERDRQVQTKKSDYKRTIESGAKIKVKEKTIEGPLEVKIGTNKNEEQKI